MKKEETKKKPCSKSKVVAGATAAAAAAATVEVAAATDDQPITEALFDTPENAENAADAMAEATLDEVVITPEPSVTAEPLMAEVMEKEISEDLPLAEVEISDLDNIDVVSELDVPVAEVPEEMPELVEEVAVAEPMDEVEIAEPVAEPAEELAVAEPVAAEADVLSDDLPTAGVEDDDEFLSTDLIDSDDATSFGSEDLATLTRGKEIEGLQTPNIVEQIIEDIKQDIHELF